MSSRGGRWAALLPALVFVALLGATWRGWLLPFQDAGREVLVPQRILEGERLYRDIVWWYGPLPPLLDALALAVRDHLDALILVRVLFALAGAEALRRLASRATGSAAAGAAVAAATVAACFFLPCGGAAAFPYSAAALEGTVLCWWALETALSADGLRGSLAAGVLAGLAAGMKAEMVPFAAVAIVPALLTRRPRRELAIAGAAAAVLAAAAWSVPLLLAGRRVLEARGPLSGVPDSWVRFYRGLFWGASPVSWVLSAALFGSALLLLRRTTGATRVAGAALLGLLPALVPGNAELQLLVPAAVVLAAMEIVRAARGRADAVLLALGVALLVPAMRQPFGLDAMRPYTTFSAPLAVVFALCNFARASRAPHAAAVFVTALALADGIKSARAYREAPRRTVTYPRGTLRLLSGEADLLAALVARIGRDTAPGSRVAGFPEPGLVLFLSGRRSPFAEVQFHPGMQNESGRADTIAAIERLPIAAAFVLNRTHPEFGGGVWGLDYDREVLAALRARMAPAGVVGRHDPHPPACLRADEALYFLPRTR